MGQCKAKTQKGTRCKIRAREDDSDYCQRHAGKEEFTIENIVNYVGDFLGNVIDTVFEDDELTKKKVFVSFDYDNDKSLKEFIVGQANNPDVPFEITDHSLKEAAPERSWERKAEAAIKRSDLVMVMLGEDTYRAPGVLKEVAMARKHNVQLVQVIGYKKRNYKLVPNAGRLYRWNWNNLKKNTSLICLN